MDKKIQGLAYALQSSLLLMAILGIVSPIFLIPGATFLIFGFKSKNDSNKTILLSSNVNYILSKYRLGLKNAIRSVGMEKGQVPRKLNDLLCRFELGNYEAENTVGLLSGNIESEFVWILSHGLSTGRNVRKILERFSYKMRNHIMHDALLLSKSSNSNQIALLGLVFFLPLFGGISSTIFGMSSSISGTAVHFLKWQFTLVLLSYIALVMSINSIFRNPKKTIVSSVCEIIPMFSISAAIMLLSAAYMPYVV